MLLPVRTMWHYVSNIEFDIHDMLLRVTKVSLAHKILTLLPNYLINLECILLGFLHRAKIPSHCQKMHGFFISPCFCSLNLTNHRNPLHGKICIHNRCLPLHVTYDRYRTMHSLCWFRVFSDVWLLLTGFLSEHIGRVYYAFVCALYI